MAEISVQRSCSSLGSKGYLRIMIIFHVLHFWNFSNKLLKNLPDFAVDIWKTGEPGPYLESTNNNYFR